MTANILPKAMAALVACLAIHSLPALAASSDLDPTFGTGGKVVTPIGAGDDNAQSVAVQSDGKIVVAGDSHNGTNCDFALARYNANGSLDASFGAGGKVITPFGSGNDRAFGVALQSDGKIVAAGYTDKGSEADFALVRYHADGTLDTTFGGTGKVTTDINSGSGDYATSMAVQSDGKILVAGVSSKGTSTDFALVRYQANGTLDASFGNSGRVTTSFGSESYGRSVAVQSDGKIVVAGSAESVTNSFFALARYQTNGTLDVSFGLLGKVVTSIANIAYGYSVAVQSDGKIVVAGSSFNGSEYDFALARYQADGTLDTAFGSGGKVTTDFGNNFYEMGLGVAVQSDGKILVAGISWDGSDNADFALACYLTNGALDTTFGSGGKVTTPISIGDEGGYSIALQSDGKILVAGASDGGGIDYDFALVRYVGTGPPDPEIAVEQPVGTNLADGQASINFGGALPGGMPVVRTFTVRNVGTTNLTGLAVGKDGANAGDFAVGGLGATSLAPAASTTFTVTFAPSALGPRTAAVHIASNDADESPFDVALVGTGVPPVAITMNSPLPSGTVGAAYSLALTASGGTTPYTWSVSAGSLPEGLSLSSAGALSGTPTQAMTASFTVRVSGAGDASSATKAFDLRILGPFEPGALDTAFGSGGKVTTAVPGPNSRANGLAVQSDGKLLVAGGSFNGSNYDFALVRYHADGSLDASFGNLGMVTTPIGTSQDYARSVAVQSDGKIVVAGDSNNGTNSDFALVRYNANGTLDTSFGSGGKVTTSFSGTSGEAGQSVAVQSDGKIVVAGYSDNGTVNYDFALVRYNADGTLDTTFGTGGKVVTPIGSGDDYGQSVAVRSDGIVVAGYAENGSGDGDFALARYRSDGSLDTTFGIGGKVITPIGLYGDSGQSVAVQSDGKIVVAGSSSNGGMDDYDFALARYLSDGSLDTTFGNGGKVTTDIGSSSDDSGQSVALQSDGKIVVAGSSYNGANYDFALVRYQANGTLDTSFGNGGKMITPVGDSDDIGWSVAVQRDGKIVVAGDSRNGSDYDFALVRYLGTTEPEIAVEQPAGNNLADGGAEIDFGNLAVDGGPAVRSFTVRNASTATLTGLAVSKDGANSGDFTVGALGATTLAPGDSTTFAVSFLPGAAGSRTAAIHIASNDADENPFDIALFGTGLVGPDIMTDSPLPSGMVGAAYDLTLAASGGVAPYTWSVSDGSLPAGLTLSDAGVLSGTPTSTTNASFTVRVRGSDSLASTKAFTLTIIATLDPGDLDPTFGVGGKVTTAIDSADDYGYSVAMQSDGKIVVAGYSRIGGADDFALVRYQTDGTLDTSFGNGGKVTTPVGSYGDLGKSVALQSDGKILVAGDYWSGGRYDFALVRYQSNGSLDTTFGSGGKVTNSFVVPNYGKTVLVQSDGKIVVAGEVSGNCVNFGLVCYLADGSLDTTFGNGGKVTTDFGTNSCDYPQSAALQADGKILVAGYAPGPNGNDFALVRYLPDGNLDTTFDGDGKVTTPIGTGGDFGRSVVVQSDGKIVVAGEIGGGNFALARYETDGTPGRHLRQRGQGDHGHQQLRRLRQERGRAKRRQDRGGRLLLQRRQRRLCPGTLQRQWHLGRFLRDGRQADHAHRQWP